jgi:NAD(P)-dependent dehydrogenase (short-subunit alcohol dehydrogenase family)
MPTSPEALFRAGVLDGAVVAVASAGGPTGARVAAAAARLGATAALLGPEPPGDGGAGHIALGDPTREDAVGEAIGTLLDRHGRLDVLVDDAAARFAQAQDGDGGDLPALRAALDGAWLLARAAGTRAMIEADGGGRLIALAPTGRDGDHERAATRAGLENMARTLSIEWARYGIRPTCVLPGAHAGDDELAALVAYLASPAGGYFSGCVLELGAVAPAPA